jgi:soluble lytic murein transglycosylase-like protein
MEFLRQFALVLLLSAFASAAEIAVLRNGYTIRHENREEIGELTRLYLSTDRSSFVDIATTDVERFERDDSPVFPSAPPDAVAAAPKATTRTSLMTPFTKSPKASPQEIADAIGLASSRYRLDPDFVSSVVSAESGFNSRAVSPKGAQGLMQLMPGTASQLGVDNAFDAAKNTDGGTRYLRMLLERFNFDVAKALAAYNAGPLRVDQHNGVPPYLETRKYVARIINDYNRKKLAQEKSTAGKTATAKAKPPTTPSKAAAKTRPSTKASTVYQAETFHQQ